MSISKINPTDATIKNPFGNVIFLTFFFLVVLMSLPSRGQAQQLICPELGSAVCQGVPFTPTWNNNLPLGTKTIPVVVHLLNSASGLSPSQVQVAIDRLNADFHHANPNYDINFHLAKFDPYGRCTDGITKYPGITSTGASSNFASLTQWPNQSYLNIWVSEIVNDDPDFLGATAVQPSNFCEENNIIYRSDKIAGQSPVFDSDDGVIIKKDYFYPNNPQYAILTHEVGHWLNLLHIFTPCGDVYQNNPPGFWNCCHDPADGDINGDFIEDTAPQKIFSTYNPADCSNGGNGCGFAGLPDADNFMGYWYPCQDKFTQGQREWMFACLGQNRPFIWSAENLRCTGVTAANNAITSSITWDFSYAPSGFIQVSGELFIKNNATLTVAAGITVQFCEDAKAIVEPGSHLILYGTLTNSCSGRMWKGVEVRGDDSKTQGQTNGIYHQSRFTAWPGSIIENAEIAILAGNTGGGMIKCEGTVFRNNQKAVEFQHYENHYSPPFPNKVTSNVSHFFDCEFVTNSDYPGDNPSLYELNEALPFHAFADLNGVRGISFLGCDFSNLRTDLFSGYQYGRGIIATESGFSVGTYCNTQSPVPYPCPGSYIDKSTFKNLYEGIYVGATDIEGELPKNYSVQSVLFEGCWIGIRSHAGSRGFIVQNHFKIGNIPSVDGALALYGVFLEDEHTTFTLQENTFELASNTPQDVLDYIGLVGSHTQWVGETNNIIRKNYYKNLKIANQSRGDNADLAGIIGLVYLCNENEGVSTYDFNVASGQGIRTIQGILQFVPPVTSKISAGNYFSHIGSTESDFRNNASNSLRYFYALGNLLETPVTYTTSSIMPEGDAQSRQCESIFCIPPCRSEEVLAQEKLAIIEAKTNYNNVHAAYIYTPNGPNAAAQKTTMTALQTTIHTNTFDVLTHIVANEGSREEYQYWLGNLDSYDSDLALAKAYLGAGELTLSTTELNEMPVKYALNGNKLAEFNGYRAILDMLNSHFQNGGTKYDLSENRLNMLKNYAETSDYARVRGLAKQILAIYDILYPPEEENGGERFDGQKLAERPVEKNAFTLMPNPADQSVYLEFPKEYVQTALQGQATLFSIFGNQMFSYEINSGQGRVQLPLAEQPAGSYFLQVKLNNGVTTTLPIVISH